MAGLKPLHPTIINHTYAGVDTEEDIQLPPNTVDLHIRLRDVTKSVKIAFIAGNSGTNFITLDSNFPSISLEDVFLSNLIIRTQTPDVAVVLEILALR